MNFKQHYQRNESRVHAMAANQRLREKGFDITDWYIRAMHGNPSNAVWMLQGKMDFQVDKKVKLMSEKTKIVMPFDIFPDNAADIHFRIVLDELVDPKEYDDQGDAPWNLNTIKFRRIYEFLLSRNSTSSGMYPKPMEIPDNLRVRQWVTDKLFDDMFIKSLLNEENAQYLYSLAMHQTKKRLMDNMDDIILASELL